MLHDKLFGQFKPYLFKLQYGLQLEYSGVHQNP